MDTETAKHETDGSRSTEELRARLWVMAHGRNLDLAADVWRQLDSGLESGGDSGDEEFKRSVTAASSVLMTCAMVEEVFWQFAAHRAEGTRPDLPGTGLDRYRAALIGGGVSLGAWWSNLHHVWTVRHTIIHANGRVDMMDEAIRPKLDAVLDHGPTRDWLSIHHDRLRIAPEFVEWVFRQADAAIYACAEALRHEDR